MKRPSVRRILHVVGVLILIASVIPFVLYAVPEAGGADYSFVVTSESMSPAIPLGSIVLVDDRGTEAYETGDVITFRTGSDPAPTTHRIADVRQTDDGQAFVTKGDANDDPDSSTVDPEQVLGEVALTIPYAGHVVLFVNSKFGFFAFIAIPLGLLLLDTVWRVVSGRGAGDGSTTTTDAEAPSEPAKGVGSSGSEAAGTTHDGSSGRVTVTTNDLRMTLVVLVLFAGYGGWTITRGLTPVTIAVTVATGSAAVIVLGLILASRFGGRATEPTRTPVAGGGASTGDTDRLPGVPATTADGSPDEGVISIENDPEFLTAKTEFDGGGERTTDGGTDETGSSYSTTTRTTVPSGDGTMPYRRINDHDE